MATYAYVALIDATVPAPALCVSPNEGLLFPPVPVGTSQNLPITITPGNISEHLAAFRIEHQSVSSAGHKEPMVLWIRSYVIPSTVSSYVKGRLNSPAGLRPRGQQCGDDQQKGNTQDKTFRSHVHSP